MNYADGKGLSPYDMRLLQSLSDFEQTLSALAFIDELYPDEKITRIELRRYRCIEDAAVVAYWRPFTECKGLPKLSLKRLGVNLTVEETKLHDQIKSHRNKVVAHTDVERMKLSFRTWKPSERHEIIMPLIIRDDNLALFDLREDWNQLTRRIHHAVAETVFELAQRLGEAGFLFVPES